MATTPIFKVEFVVRKQNPTNQGGRADAYRRDPHVALVSAEAPSGILAILASNFSLASGESFDILHTSSLATGTEGQMLL